MRIATRGSPLALWQAQHVATLLGGDCEVVVVHTQGDARTDEPLWRLGGKGVFVKEVQAAVLDGRADIAVHSGKDLPSIPVDGLTIGAVPERGDPRDALVGARLADLPPGARVATGSIRRRAQLAHARPDLTFAELRGNMATRVAKAAEYGAVVVAAVALERLGWGDQIAEILDPAVVLPQVAQGAVVVECRDGDDATLAALAAVDHPVSRRTVEAERGFLAELGGDCDLPAGAHATSGPDGALALEAMLASPDGHAMLRHRVEAAPGDDPAATGRAAARHLLHHGGNWLLSRSSSR